MYAEPGLEFVSLCHDMSNYKAIDRSGSRTFCLGGGMIQLLSMEQIYY